MESAKLSVWEIVASFALIGMGLCGMISPKGLAASTFFPAFRESVDPLLVATIVFLVGAARALILVLCPWCRAARISLSLIAAVLWGQWAIGFLLVASVQGLRAGMAQQVAMTLGEVMFIFRIAAHREKRIRR